MKPSRSRAAPEKFSLVAKEIVELEQTRLPNLSAVTIVLPNLKAAAGIASSLAEAANLSTLILPRFTTLPDWAGKVNLDINIIPMGQRQTLLYQALRAKNWFAAYDLWQITDELLSLIDELNDWQTDFPENSAVFMETIAGATLKKVPEALRFEARLVYELWEVLNKTTTTEMTPAMAYALRLRYLAENLSQPTYGIDLRDLIPVEEMFFTRLEERGIARRFSSNAGANNIFNAAWLQQEQAPNIRLRAQTYAQEFPAAPLGGLVLYGAYSLESEARAIELSVREWLTEGKNNIALIAQDRLVARRVRALLERAQVLIEDETGWTFSTTSASAVVIRLLDTLENNFACADFLDLAKSSFLFAETPSVERRAAVSELEKLARKHNVSAGFNNFFHIAKEHGSPPTINFLQEFWQASREYNLQPKTLTLWLETLLQTLSRLGALDALRADEAGRQLLVTLQGLQENLRSDAGVFSAQEWRAWLNRQLEGTTFRDASIKSSIVFTHLSLTRAREFDAVAIIGADTRHLPGNSEAQSIFDEGIRLELGLPTSASRRAVQKQDLIDLLSTTPASLITWQRYLDEETNLISPYFEQLSVFHELAFHKSLEDADFEFRLAQYTQTQINPDLATQPPQAKLASWMPQTISAAGYNTLMQCPYQFYARYGLRLTELDDIQLDMEKKHYGTCVHEILRRFHTEFSSVLGRSREEMKAALLTISQQVFAPAVALNFNARAWELRWLAIVPSYLDWQYAREQEGWQWQGAEITKELPLTTGDDLYSFTLSGRIDRVDKRGEAEYAVLDYKTRDKGKLRELLKPPMEEMPLLVYALLWGEPVSEAGFLCLNETTQFLPYCDDLQANALHSKQLLSDLFAAIHSGATLPAQGIEAVCAYCKMEGLCRKGYWRV